jgi:hypothetical protein
MTLRMTTSTTRWLGALLAASPAIVPLVWIYRYGVNFHFRDEWMPDIAGALVKAAHHHLTLADVLAQHNEHRIVIPRLFLLLIAPLTHWNNFATLLFEWAILCLTSLLVLRLCRQTVRDSARPHSPADARGLGGRTLWIWFLCNLLIFTPTQAETLLWGMLMANVMASFFVLLGIVVACSSMRYWIKLPISVLAALAATYSSGNGILAWGLVGVLLIWPAAWNDYRTRKAAVAVWIAACLLGLGLYFVGYVRPPHVVSTYSPSARNIVLYTLAFSGSAFAKVPRVPPLLFGVIVGSILLAILLFAAGYFVYGWVHEQRLLCDSILIWLAVAGYGVLSGLLAAFFRAGITAEWALWSRYVSYGLYVPLAVIPLVLILLDHLQKTIHLRDSKIRIQLSAALLALLLVLQTLSFPWSVKWGRSNRLDRREAKAALLLANIFPDNPQLAATVYLERGELLDEARALSAIGYLQPPLIHTRDARKIYQEEPDPAAPSIGELDGIGRDAVSGEIVVNGWAINPRVGEIADAVFLTYDDEHQEPIIFSLAVLNGRRDDVATQLHNQNYRWCGWIAPAPLDRVPAGIKTLRLTAWALDADTGKARLLDGVVTLPRPEPPTK